MKINVYVALHKFVLTTSLTWFYRRHTIQIRTPLCIIDSQYLPLSWQTTCSVRCHTPRNDAYTISQKRTTPISQPVSIANKSTERETSYFAPKEQPFMGVIFHALREWSSSCGFIHLLVYLNTFYGIILQL